MMRDQDLRQLVVQAQQRLQKVLRDAEVLVVDLANIQRALPASSAHRKPTTSTPAPNTCTRVAIANGRHLTDDEVQTLDDDACDVILDMTSATLRYRENPEQHSPLKPSHRKGMGPYRIKILAFMIDRFGVLLCSDNVDDLLGDANRAATPQAFTKHISILRQALGSGGSQNPYIQSIAAWESSRSNNARAYVLNPQWMYLLIAHGKSQKSPSGHDAIIKESDV